MEKNELSVHGIKCECGAEVNLEVLYKGRIIKWGEGTFQLFFYACPACDRIFVGQKLQDKFIPEILLNYNGYLTKGLIKLLNPFFLDSAILLVNETETVASTGQRIMCRTYLPL